MTTACSKHILSFGGGVNSTALMILLVSNGEPLDEVVFADTGGELPETYEHLEHVRQYLQHRAIPLTILAHRIHGRDLYETCWHRKVIPSALWRWSTRDFKVRPIHRYYRTVGCHISQYLAIAYDEIERMRDSTVPLVTNLYPLVDRKISRNQCVSIIEDAGFPVPIKSSCFFCPFGSLDRWRFIHDNHPALYSKAIALEENSKHFPLQRLTDQVFRHRASVTLRELPRFLNGPLSTSTPITTSICGAECDT